MEQWRTKTAFPAADKSLACPCGSTLSKSLPWPAGAACFVSGKGAAFYAGGRRAAKVAE